MVPNVIVYRYNPGREPKLDFQQERTGPSGSVDRLANMNRTLFLPLSLTQWNPQAESHSRDDGKKSSHTPRGLVHAPDSLSVACSLF